MDDRTRWNERYRTGRGPRRVNERLAHYLHLLKRGRALDLACGIGQNAALLSEWVVILVDLSEEALEQAQGLRVQADAGALPFPPGTFDTIVNTNFYDPRVQFRKLLTAGGTLFFETFTKADEKYRPDLDPAHRFDLARVPEVLRGFEILVLKETDDGHRVFATIVARRSESE